jgi:hypothetical protein
MVDAVPMDAMETGRIPPSVPVPTAKSPFPSGASEIGDRLRAIADLPDVANNGLIPLYKDGDFVLYAQNVDVLKNGGVKHMIQRHPVWDFTTGAEFERLFQSAAGTAPVTSGTNLVRTFEIGDAQFRFVTSLETDPVTGITIERFISAYNTQSTSINTANVADSIARLEQPGEVARNLIKTKDTPPISVAFEDVKNIDFDSGVARGLKYGGWTQPAPVTWEKIGDGYRIVLERRGNELFLIYAKKVKP